MSGDTTVTVGEGTPHPVSVLFEDDGRTPEPERRIFASLHALREVIVQVNEEVRKSVQDVRQSERDATLRAVWAVIDEVAEKAEANYLKIRPSQTIKELHCESWRASLARLASHLHCSPHNLVRPAEPRCEHIFEANYGLHDSAQRYCTKCGVVE